MRESMLSKEWIDQKDKEWSRMVAQFYHMQNYDTSLKFILLELKVRDLEMKMQKRDCKAK